MASASVTYSFTSGSTASASEVNQNFTDLLTFLNSTGVTVYQANSVDATAIDLSIAPTWTGIHTFSAAPYHGVQSFSDNGTIATASGRKVVFTSGASKTLTLPAAAVGLEFEIINVSSENVTISRDGSDTIVDGSTTGQTSVKLPAGARMNIECYASATWYSNYTTSLFYTGQFTVSSGTGSASVTGVGFRPSNIIVFGTDGASSSVGMLQIGAASSASTEVSAVMRADSTDGNMNQSTGTFYKILDDNDATVDADGSLTTFDSDGFTYSRDTSSGSSHTVNFIAMR